MFLDEIKKVMEWRKISFIGFHNECIFTNGADTCNCKIRESGGRDIWRSAGSVIKELIKSCIKESVHEKQAVLQYRYIEDSESCALIYRVCEKILLVSVPPFYLAYKPGKQIYAVQKDKEVYQMDYIWVLWLLF